MARDVPPDAWETAKSEVRAILTDVARECGLVTYAGLAASLRAVRLHPHAPAVARLLREVSTEDHERGRGMRSALVVFKSGGRPGAGFFALARELGMDVSDRDAFWRGELAKVYADWAP